jgi:hypothetical protein
MTPLEKDEGPGTEPEANDQTTVEDQGSTAEPTPMVDAPGKVRPAPREPDVTHYRRREGDS